MRRLRARHEKGYYRRGTSENEVPETPLIIFTLRGAPCRRRGLFVRVLPVFPGTAVGHLHEERHEEEEEAAGSLRCPSLGKTENGMRNFQRKVVIAPPARLVAPLLPRRGGRAWGILLFLLLLLRESFVPAVIHGQSR